MAILHWKDAITWFASLRLQGLKALRVRHLALIEKQAMANKREAVKQFYWEFNGYGFVELPFGCRDRCLQWY